MACFKLCILPVPVFYFSSPFDTVPNFEAAKLLMSEILVFPASLELYNSFDTLFVCFHGLME